MKQEELSIEKLHSYSGWRLDPTKLVDSKLIAAQEALFLVAAVIAQIQTRSEKTSSLDYLFYTVSGALFLLIVSSLLANEKLLKGRLKVGFLGLLSTTLQLALLGILKSTYCLENSTCSFKEATSETVLSNCFSCVRISSSSPPETVRGLQLTYSRSTPILLFALLGFENKPCQLIYSLIPLQVYMVSFPNLSQAEKITGYICLSGNILTCLIKCYSIYGLKRKTTPKILGFATK